MGHSRVRLPGNCPGMLRCPLPVISLEDLQGDGRVLDGSNDTAVVQVEDMVFFLEDLWG